jgi:pyrroloquinoline quinone (PQQ) biosynthesis protein C
MPLSVLAKEEIERKTKEISSSNPLFVRAREGVLTREEMSLYLTNLRFLFSHGVGYLKRAAKVARQREQIDLAKFYEGKIGEEVGHEGWADEDLKHYSSSFARENVLPSAVNIVNFVNSIIDEDPRLFLGYMLFVEYFTVLAAPEWLSNVETRCGIKPSEVSAISNHEEADRDHAQEDLEVIGRLVSGEKISRRFQEVLIESANLVRECMTSCCH